MDQIQSIVQDSLSGIWEGFLQRIPHLSGALVILLLTWLLAKLLCRVVNVSMHKLSKRESLIQLMLRLARTSVWLIGIVAAAMIVFPGLTPSKALGAAGLASVAIGLAFKDIFQNFFAGVMLLWKFPFEEGDLIECGDVTGRVKAIELRHTLIQDTSGELIIVPNSKLVTEPVEVLTYRDSRRIEFTVGVSYDTDVPRAQSIIEKTVGELEHSDPNKESYVFASEFGASSIDFEILFWANSEPMGMRRAKAEAVCKIKKALDDASIEIPFPYRTLTFNEPLKIHSIDEGNSVPQASSSS